jgi:hypothetical protein
MINECLKYYLKHEQQCFIRYKDGLIKHALGNVLNCFKSDRSRLFLGEVAFKRFIVYVEKTKVKVLYVNQGKSLSHIKIRHV